jgi:hypothetical protein
MSEAEDDLMAALEASLDPVRLRRERDELRAENTRLREALREFRNRVETDRREADKLLCHCLWADMTLGGDDA